MKFLLDLCMRWSLKTSVVLNKITGRSSKECMHKLYLYATVVIVISRIAVSVGLGLYFDAGLTLALWGTVYPGLHMAEVKIFRKDFWDDVESRYEPPNIMICPLVFPRYDWRTRVFDVKMWMFFALAQLVFSITSFAATSYYYGFLSFTSFLLFLLNGLWSANNFFYHQMNNKSLYSRAKDWLRQKMENRQKTSILVPIPA